MSKYCTKCGQMLSDDALFCASCGAKQEEPQTAGENVCVEQPQQPVVEKPNAIQKALQWAKTKPLYAGGIIVGAVAILIGALFLFGVFGSAYDEAIDNYVAVLNGDASISTLKKLYPEELWEDMDLRDVSEEVDEMMKYAPDDYECTYEIESEKEITGALYTDLQDVLEVHYDIDADDVGDAYKLELKLTVKADGETQSRNSSGAAVVKIEGQWYLVMINEYNGEIRDVTFPEF